MRRAWAICPTGSWNPATAVDRVVIGSRTGGPLRGESGAEFELALDGPAILRNGDGIVLDDGSVVMVIGVTAPLLELTMRQPGDAVRLAWHLGNRHVPLQIDGERLRVCRDPVVADIARRFGADVREIEAPFEPMSPPAAHRHGGHDHVHPHDQDHDAR